MEVAFWAESEEYLLEQMGKLDIHTMKINVLRANMSFMWNLKSLIAMICALRVQSSSALQWFTGDYL